MTHADTANSRTVDRHVHWEAVYRSKEDAQLSWHQTDPRCAKSFELIQQFAPPDARIIDVGGGNSMLAAALFKSGFEDITVLDISEAAIERAKNRIGAMADSITWVAADVTTEPALQGPFDVWHDRAVFHFLTDPVDQRAYISLCTNNIARNGVVVIGTFALDGPNKCSGLPVQRYDAHSLAKVFGPEFELIGSSAEVHQTPWGKAQAFTYAVLRKASS